MNFFLKLTGHSPCSGIVDEISGKRIRFLGSSGWHSPYGGIMDEISGLITVHPMEEIKLNKKKKSMKKNQCPEEAIFSFTNENSKARKLVRVLSKLPNHSERLCSNIILASKPFSVYTDAFRNDEIITESKFSSVGINERVKQFDISSFKLKREISLELSNKLITIEEIGEMQNDSPNRTQIIRNGKGIIKGIWSITIILAMFFLGGKFKFSLFFRETNNEETHLAKNTGYNLVGSIYIDGKRATSNNVSSVKIFGSSIPSTVIKNDGSYEFHHFEINDQKTISIEIELKNGLKCETLSCPIYAPTNKTITLEALYFKTTPTINDNKNAVKKGKEVKQKKKPKCDC